jgi:transposase InsO family protein
LVEATATEVQDIYLRLFDEHGPPLVLKSDNGGQFKADTTKAVMAAQDVLPLYSPKRHPQYNGGVERANGQLASYQEAVAQFHERPAGPTCDDAEHARQLANELAHPHGWQGPTAGQLWEQRLPLTPQERAAFLATVETGRTVTRAHWNFAPDAALTHYQAAAIDRRAIRDALVVHDLLRIHPRHQRGARCQHNRTPTRGPEDAPGSAPKNRCGEVAPTTADSSTVPAPPIHGAGTMESQPHELASPTVGEAPDRGQRLLALVRYLFRGGPFLR